MAARNRTGNSEGLYGLLTFGQREPQPADRQILQAVMFVRLTQGLPRP